MTASRFDARQTKLTAAQAMIGSAASDTLDTILPKVNDELAKLFEDRNLLLAEGGTIAVNAGATSVTFSASLKLHINSLVAGGSPKVIDLGSTTRAFTSDGNMLYAVINRTAVTATMTADASTLPAVTSANQEVVLIAKRIGTTIYFRNSSIPAGRSTTLSGSDLYGSLGSITNQLVKTSGTDGKTLQGTGITVDASNNVTGIGSLGASSLALSTPLPITSGGTGSGTQNFVDLTTVQSIAGAKTFTTSVSAATLTATGIFQESISTDSTTTGTGATLTAFTTPIIRLTNASLVSLDMIPAGSQGESIKLINATGVTFNIDNLTGATAANQIITGTGNTLALVNNASLVITYDTVSSKWRIIGGSGMGIAIGKETQVLRVVAGQAAWSEEDRSNLLLNPNFEETNTAGVGTSWTNSSTGSTPTITTTSGEFSEGLQAQKIALSSGVLNFFQSQNTPAGITKQGKVGITYRAAAAIAGFQVCSLVDGVEQVCVPTANLTIDDTFHTIEIPIVFGTTSAGIKVKSTSSTGNVFLDSAYVSRGLGVQNLQGDTVYSAQVITGTGVISYQNKPFITSCTAANPAVCTFASGYFTTTPACQATVNGNPNIIPALTISSSTSFLIGSYVGNSGSANSPNAVVITCEKQGADYANASSAAYVSTNGNYDWTSYTPTLAGLGTVSPSASQCKHRRVGGDLEVNCYFTTGTPTATLASISLPNSLTLDSTRIIAANTTSAAGQAFGWSIESSTLNQSAVVSAIGTSTSLLYLGDYITHTGGNFLVPQNGSAMLAVGSVTSISFKVPIAGWTNSNLIVGSFAGYNSTPGTISPKIISAQILNNGTCSIDKQVGGGITSVSHPATGRCLLNFTSAFWTVTPTCSCTPNGSNATTVCNFSGAAPSASSIDVTTVSMASSGTYIDSHFHVMCQGY